MFFLIMPDSAQAGDLAYWHEMVKHVIYPCWLYGQIFGVLSPVPPPLWQQPMKAQLRQVHEEREFLIHQFDLEQLGFLLTSVCVNLNEPRQLHGHLVTEPEYRFYRSCAEASIEVVLNARTDFKHRKTICIERRDFICDGKTLHFSASEIFYEKQNLFKRLEEKDLLPKIETRLDTFQQRAVACKWGPVRLLAPAGSGKTRTLVNRVASLVKDRVPQRRILTLAFNTKAREEMRMRLKTMGLSQVHVYTLHALGYRLIKQKVDWRVSTKDSHKRARQLIKKAINRKWPHWQPDLSSIDRLLERIGRCKTELVELEQTIKLDTLQFSLHELFSAFIHEQFKAHFINFDDLIYLALLFMVRDPVLRSNIQNQYDYILVDEFQDLNASQWLLVQLLALPQNHLFVVGDDDQMIYGWRGARVEPLLKFEEHFPASECLALQTNYRSSQAVIRHADWLIRGNKIRLEKTILPRESAPEGQIEIRLCDTLVQQIETAIEWIRSGQPPVSDYAVLFRQNIYRGLFSLILDGYKLSYRTLDRPRGSDSEFIKVIIAYLELIYNRRQEPAIWQAVLRYPNRFLRESVVEKISSILGLERMIHADLACHEKWQLEALHSQITGLWNRERGVEHAEQALDWLDSCFGLEQATRSGFRERPDYDQQSTYYILKYWSRAYADVDRFISRLHDLVHRLEQAPTQENEGILLSTIHSVKGNEFNHVVYLDFLHRSADRTEEERRVSYVALTRAISDLLVTGRKDEISPFLLDYCLHPQLRSVKIQKLQRALNKGDGRLTKRFGQEVLERELRHRKWLDVC
jgi:DNA helicase-2/ATP-dependent DNA helicase PcrA